MSLKLTTKINKTINETEKEKHYALQINVVMVFLYVLFIQHYYVC